jgi:hypothetical protein
MKWRTDPTLFPFALACALALLLVLTRYGEPSKAASVGTGRPRQAQRANG